MLKTPKGREGVEIFAPPQYRRGHARYFAEGVARSRSWMGAALAGKTASIDEIAAVEGLAERHIRRLVPLAFLSPTIVQAIADGTAPAGLTVSRLTQALPHAWTAQEQMGLS